MATIRVTKANGERVAFDQTKIRRSLSRVGAKPALIDEILVSLNKSLYDGIPTLELYRIVFAKLKELQKGIAGRYNLKHAVMQLGPIGFPFERLIAALFQSDGFRTKVGQIVRGSCVGHEVDVLAEKANLHYLAECKFHSFQGKVCDVKHALYVHARFLDIKKELLLRPEHQDKSHKGWLVTNTRLTSDAVAYGTCVGLGLLSRDFPAEKSLRAWIEGSGLHPVTCLTSLSVKQKRQLLERGIVLCRDLSSNQEILKDIGIPPSEVAEVFEEVDGICYGGQGPA